ncbi:T9SS type A sorting domain-containing protein [Winogradskyella damuponensis]
MYTKNCINLLKCLAVSVLFLLPLVVSAQTVTNVFPTRVTTGSKITIIGTGFYDGLQHNIDTGYTGQGEKTYVSPTEMTVKITTNSTSDQIKIFSVSGATIDSGVNDQINYIAPTSKSITYNSVNRVREVYTTWDKDGNGDNFWKSSDFVSSDSSTFPNDRHVLLGFKMSFGGATGDVIFSTGVNDALLETKLAALGIDVSATSTMYKRQNFKAYSTNGVSGKPNSNNYIGFADKIDGHSGSIVLNNAVRKTVYDVIIDGDNGLDLGTGIANFNDDADIRFYSGNGDVGAVSDGIPDLLITQMAQPGGSDVYYYADVNGNVVGRPVKLSFNGNNNTRLYQWKVDFYRLDTSSNSTFQTAIPTTASFGNGQTRGFRMAALSLEDFGIDGSVNADINDIDNINMGAGGSSDMAFMSYNKASFAIKSPVILKSPVSRFICRLPSNSNLTFTAQGDIEGTPTSDPNETISYTWFRNNVNLGESSNSFSIPAGLTSADLEDTDYRVRVKNGYGAVDLPFIISEGGTPTYWDGSNWVLPSIYTENNISVPNDDRSLIIAAEYNEIANVVGCDCTVSAGKNVILSAGSTMTLYNSLIVEPLIPANPSEGTLEVPAGTFIIENDASLVQIKNSDSNLNSGDIIVRRNVEASTLHQNDYVYWSAPVNEFNLSGILNTAAYQWLVNEDNANGEVGNWVSAANTTMAAGKGYILRVTNDQATNGFTAEFEGVPNNGTVSVSVFKSGSSVDEQENKHWNLIGNPYPSAINTDKFLANNTNIEGRVDLWMHTNEVSNSVDSPFYENFVANYGDQYITYNGVGSSDPYHGVDRNIASGQGFFVQVMESSVNTSTVEFTNDMRYDAAENSYNNSQFYRNNLDEAINESEKQLVWLSIANDNNIKSTLIGYVDGATEGKDRLYDAYTNGSGLNLYSLISNHQKLVIQGLPLPFLESNSVPLGFEIANNGVHTIAIGSVQGSVFVEQEQAIFLEDTYTGIIHNLRTSPYNFVGEVGEYNDRFILRYTSPLTLSDIDVWTLNTFAYINDAKCYVTSSARIEALMIFDISGKQMVNYKPNNSTALVAPFNFAKGVYIAYIKLDNGNIVTKKLIN